MGKILVLLSLLVAINASACGLRTSYWPVPMGYNKGSVDFEGLVRRQMTWNSSSDVAFDINPSMKNVQMNIENIIKHHEYIGYFPEHAKGLKFKALKLISFRGEPAGGNSFLSEGKLEGIIGYSLQDVGLSLKKLEKIWLIVLEYELVLSWPNDRLDLSYKIEIPTLPDGTILYQYTGLDGC